MPERPDEFPSGNLRAPIRVLIELESAQRDFDEKELLLALNLRSAAGDDARIVQKLEGTLHPIEDGFLLSYEEQDAGGLEGSQTRLHLTRDGATLDRRGAHQLSMRLEPGKIQKMLYPTPYGALPLTVETLVYRPSLEAAEAGEAWIVYRLDFAGQAPLLHTLRCRWRAIGD